MSVTNISAVVNKNKTAEKFVTDEMSQQETGRNGFKDSIVMETFQRTARESLMNPKSPAQVRAAKV
jgi:hypothetical protein